MKRMLIVGLLLSVSAGFLSARTIDPELPYRYAYWHYPVDRYDNQDGDWCMHYNAFAGGYHRSANEAFSQCSGSGKDNEVPISNLLFGKSSFRLAEAFANSSVGSSVPNNPFVGGATITPKYDFEENGAMFRFSVGTQYQCFNMGLRASLPFRDINVKQVCSGDFNGLELQNDSVDDVFQVRNETIDKPGAEPHTNTVFAARLDFLSSLQAVSFDQNGNQQPLVNYTDPNSNNRLTIAQQDVTFDPPRNPDEPSVAVIKSNDGSIPSDQRFGDVNNQITGQVAANGSGLSDNQRGEFVAANDYTPLSNDSAAQSELFVVPTLNQVDAVNELEATQGAQIVLASIRAAAESLDDSVVDFIRESGLNFCDGRTRGIGDLDLEFYLGYDWFDDACLWSELLFGVRVPTADELTNCKDVLKQPLGNDDHTELRLGGIIGWDALDWMKLMVDARYSWVLEDCENVAAPLQGAQVKNIGPCIRANVKWDYVVAHVNATFLASDCCGFDLGYEVYHKRCDEICPCTRLVTDLAGNENQPVDASVLTRNTERTSHKVRLGFYAQVTDHCQLQAGWANAFAGKNIIRDTDWYLSMAINF